MSKLAYWKGKAVNDKFLYPMSAQRNYCYELNPRWVKVSTIAFFNSAPLNSTLSFTDIALVIPAPPDTFSLHPHI